MALEERITADLKTAMLAKDDAALRGLRAIKQAILLAKTSGGGGTIAEADEVRMLQKLVKQRKESVEIYVQQGREDLAVAEREEIAVIEGYLPALMSEAEVRSALQAIIAQVGATGPGELGKVMGVATKQLAGKADNKLVSQLVKELLSGN
ncbi:GatB/YqeY domain-containing protein [Candidatus Pollutiaquabacter sp.]|uniref:GatB/YqeY domain-containing protein n=1 Tax=Candidatus Pollutiaquabacter sp. TaxID=3416354 RepID=UPI003C9E2DCC|nr:GatB/YqeY domain-containing protein [Bacteroidota bacterium]